MSPTVILICGALLIFAALSAVCGIFHLAIGT
jgi:hypothetical protein